MALRRKARLKPAVQRLRWKIRDLVDELHFKSARYLTSAAALGKSVLRVNEAYTSKTASWTGEMKNIGDAKTITSNGVTVDRDINGARGIFLRALEDNPSLRNGCVCVA